MDDEGNEIPRAVLLAAMKLIKSGKSGMPTEGAMGASSTDEGWEAVGAMGSSMTDASKRRAPAEQRPRGRMVHEGSKASEPAGPEPAMPEPTNCGQVQFPAGITSMKQWGDTLLDFGKFKGKGYHDLVSSTEAGDVSYIKWCLGRRWTPTSSALLKDFAEFIAAFQQLNEAGVAGSSSMYPGTTQRRMFKTTK
jgi:hypothetical protein